MRRYLFLEKVTRINDSVKIYVVNRSKIAGDIGIRVWCNARCRCNVFFSSRFRSQK
jgi:hypothetical protein